METLDITKIKYGNLIGLGESTHGTKEYQIVRLNIIKYLHSQYSIQVFIEANYVAIELLKVPNITKKEYINNIKKSILFNHLKSNVFCDILWFLHSNKIPYFGVDVQINIKENYPSPIVKWIKNYNEKMFHGKKDYIGYRSKGMIELINILWDQTTQGIFLAHNYHISGYVDFPGTRIGFATLNGTVTQFDNKLKKFVKSKLEYEDQELKYDKAIITKTKKWFYNSGESVEYDKQQMTGDNFDYIIFIPNTHAI